MRKRFRDRADIGLLSGVLGDEINTMLAAAVFNMKKFLNQVKARIKNLLCQHLHCDKIIGINSFYIQIFNC
jgi:hypothetical protein